MRGCSLLTQSLSGSSWFQLLEVRWPCTICSPGYSESGALAVAVILSLECGLVVVVAVHRHDAANKGDDVMVVLDSRRNAGGTEVDQVRIGGGAITCVRGAFGPHDCK